MGFWRFRMRSYAKVDNESDLVVGLIPARWASTRFEGKPLVDISGIPMIKGYTIELAWQSILIQL